MTSKKIGWVLCAIAILGCSSNENASPPTSPATDAGVMPTADAGLEGAAADASDGASPATCTLSAGERSRSYGTIRHLDGTASPPPLPGVRVCIHGRTDVPCVTTGPDGTYDQTCVPVGDVLIHFSLAGYAPTVWARVSLATDENELSTFLLRDADNQAMFATANVTYPRAGHGMVTITDKTTADGTTMAAVSANLEGPFYSADAVTIDTNASGTAGARVAFFVAPVGDVEIAITSNGGTPCRQLGLGWGGSTPGTVKVPVLEGTETSLFVICP
jgi:hypothetical protein